MPIAAPPGNSALGCAGAPRFASASRHDADALELELRNTLRHAVEQAVGQEPTGSFLSGGLDSSTVTGFAARSSRLRHAYTIGFHQPGYDESDYAKLAAGHFAADLRLYYLQPQDVEAIRAYVIREAQHEKQRLANP